MNFFYSLIIIFATHIAIAGDACYDFYNPINNSSAARVPERYEFRKQLVSKFLHNQGTTQHDRELFLKKATEPSSANKLALEFENSKLKFLNDTFKDKDVITAVDHLAIHYVLKKIEDLLHGKDFQLYKYSDGKSLSIILESSKPIEMPVRISLEHEFLKFTNDFSSFLSNRYLFRSTDHPEDWFRCGVGNTPDQAYLAARFSRKMAGKNRLIDFNLKSVQADFALTLQYTRNLAHSIQNIKAIEPLLEPITDTAFQAPGQLFFEYARKAQSGDNLKKDLQMIENIELTTDDADLLFEYAELIDSLNPKYFSIDQSVVSLADASEGGITLDKKGLGALNQVGTARAVIQATNPADFIFFNRNEELKITQSIIEYRQKIKDLFNGSCRGDDCFIKGLPNMPISQFLSHPLVKKERIVIIPANIPNPDHRTELSTQAESAEKIFAKTILRIMKRSAVSNLSWAVNVQSKILSSGPLGLIITQSNTLTDNQKSMIKKIWTYSIAELNKANGEHKMTTTYTSGDIEWY